ncbi:MAG: translation initiation factor IF-2 [Acholeplasmatales bacterium]|jgi:translation initiation factor IF-2|nr:translation initiation factor IF-2 [Acholeplasmatales bacterium]
MAYNPVNKNNYKQKLANKERVYTFVENTTVINLAEAFGVSVPTLILKYLKDLTLTVNRILSYDEVKYICELEGFKVVLPIIEDPFDRILATSDDPKTLVKRPPVVTIMGHVDHGKTTLLDTIRKSREVDREFGGITQHVNAYQVIKNQELITFVDTPGHAAFTEMRSRGAKMTDIVVLVVAADDGVQPQTIEVIDHVKASGCKIIVAINKIDRPDANVQNALSGLAARGITVEAWGGDVPCVEVSALKNINIDKLLEAILVVAEVEDYRANPKRNAVGAVIEASLDAGRGATATVLVQKGTLKVGNHLVCGTIYGKVRSIENDKGLSIKEAGPSSPVVVTGFSETPVAGDTFVVFDSQEEARNVAEKRKLKFKNIKEQSKLSSVSEQFNNLNLENKDLNVIIKGDVHGSVETIKAMLSKMVIGDRSVKVLSANPGAINENDIVLAQTSNSLVIGFNLRPNNTIRALAESKSVQIKLYTIIYRITEDLENILKGSIIKPKEEHVIGQLEVREVFRVPKVGNIAGSYVSDGYITRDSLCHLLRDQVIIYEGKISSLKRGKDDVKEVQKGFECGVGISNFDDIKVGDTIEVSLMMEVE